MIGAIIGDIVGSRFEFNNHRSTEFEFFHRDCNFTDDTVMTIAVADAIMNNRPFGEVMHEYGSKYPNRGYGARFFNWLLSTTPKPYNSYGNGSAMRVAPCALLARGNREQALTWAAASAVCTHNHPEGVKGALAVTDCILLAAEHRPMKEIRHLAQQLYGYNMDFSIDQIRPTFHFNETCQHTVPQAIEAFLESHDFESAIRHAVSLGGDSDTIACITGGMAEAYYGVPDAYKTAAMALLPPQMQGIVTRMYGKE
ncbi:MAG: ADP-ribosylglycohydrolase family protein [Bacteroidales bacterium]|nr:ADP-ribosylglycohydrolase family protein [Bacteroidales bacterium]